MPYLAYNTPLIRSGKHRKGQKHSGKAMLALEIQEARPGACTARARMTTGRLYGEPDTGR
jgi:hypothetical protein